MLQVGLDALVSKIRALPGRARHIVALAGPPAAGKSHMSEALEAALNAAGGRAAILPMDGYHYDDALLRARGRLAFKGAPDTFDVGGFRQMLARLAANTEAEIAVPVFDRALEISRGSARMISQDVQTLIVEGNYLLFESAPWEGLWTQFDMTVWVTADDATLRARLSARWQDAGLAPAEVQRKVDNNDWPNCQAILSGSRAAQFTLLP